jgi:N-acetylmuramoyl-L-alanine amidase
MPEVFLSPSTQPYNKYLNGGNEQEYMNKLADLMEPMLKKNHIFFGRNTPDTTVGASIRDSNEGYYDLHLALHTNAAPEDMAGKLRGIDVYYYEYSRYAKDAAEIIAKNLKDIYPEPELVKAVPTTKLVELRKTNAPAVLCELGYHDNPEDEKWIKDNLSEIAASLTESLCEYFGIVYHP